jgi:hypothetical protein
MVRIPPDADSAGAAIWMRDAGHCAFAVFAFR